jgi:hypothetical protein
LIERLVRLNLDLGQLSHPFPRKIRFRVRTTWDRKSSTERKVQYKPGLRHASTFAKCFHTATRVNFVRDPTL